MLQAVFLVFHIVPKCPQTEHHTPLTLPLPKTAEEVRPKSFPNEFTQSMGCSGILPVLVHSEEQSQLFWNYCSTFIFPAKNFFCIFSWSCSNAINALLGSQFQESIPSDILVDSLALLLDRFHAETREKPKGRPGNPFPPPHTTWSSHRTGAVASSFFPVAGMKDISSVLFLANQCCPLGNDGCAPLLEYWLYQWCFQRELARIHTINLWSIFCLFWIGKEKLIRFDK